MGLCNSKFCPSCRCRLQAEVQSACKKKERRCCAKKVVSLACDADVVDPQIAEEINAEAGLEPLGHRWSEEECTVLWSYVEDFQDELYHGKDNLTRPQVVAKITAMLSE